MVYLGIGNSVVDWAGKPYPEIRDIASTAGSILVVPIGSLEQHGPHLPTCTDTVLVDAVVHAGAETAGNDGVPVLVTPPVWTGHSHHHLPFGGTASITHTTLRTVLREIAATTLEHPFDALVFVNGHGGNIATTQDATAEVGQHHPDVEIIGLTYFPLAAEYVAERRDSEIGGIAHAGELETSLMLHLRPDLVREDRIEGTHYEKPYDREGTDLLEPGTITVYRSFDAYTEKGAAGDPHLASAEKGRDFFEAYDRAFADLLAEIHAARLY